MSSMFANESTVTNGSTLERAQLVTTYLLREPVKAAVREALREEGVAGRTEPRIDTQPEADSGRSPLLLGVAAIAFAGLAYYGWNRMSGESSGPGSMAQRPTGPESRASTGGGSGGSDGDGSAATVSNES